MFCTRCGAETRADLAVCPKCGQGRGNPLGLVPSRLERHLKMLGTLWMVIGGLFAIPAVFLMVFGNSVHWVFHREEPWPALFQLLLVVASGTLATLAAGGVCVGMGLMQRRQWARTAGIILGVLALFHPPLGTALGIYSLWVLLADERGEEYRHLSPAD